MTGRQGPPRFTRRLLTLLLPADLQASVPGDLEEVFRRDAARHGARHARRSYRRDALALLARLALDSLGLGGRRRRVRRARRRDGGSASLLDVKLGVRMLFKYPGLTLIGGLGMAVAIAVGVGYFSVVWHFLYPKLPLDQGDRLVALENWDVEVRNEERQALHDFFEWRREMETVREISAFRDAHRNLIDDQGLVTPISVAEMTASGFDVARVPPQLGRYLVVDDERPEAPAVVVIGHDVWQTRFGADPEVIGREMRLGDTLHTIVGVMPEDYAFPMNHGYWVPFRWDPVDWERGRGPEIFIFGRLADGVSREEAQAELTALGERATAAWPETHGNLRPMVWPYTYPLTDIQGLTLWDWDVGTGQLISIVLLLIVSMNVAVLSYARIATRRGEIAVRTALGASRSRIVLQLFVEALVLSAGAAVVGLVLARVGLVQADLIMEEEIGGAPFWGTFDMSSAAIPMLIALTVFAALIVGVVPGLQATGRGLKTTLSQLGGGTGLRLGKTWTALVVAQVAIAVCGLSLSVSIAWEMVARMAHAPNFASREILVTGVGFDVAPPRDVDPEEFVRTLPDRFEELRLEIYRRLDADPMTTEVTFASRLPGSEEWTRIEVEGVPATDGFGGHRALAGSADPDLFDALDIPILAGRVLTADEADRESAPVVVNRTFVDQLLDGQGAVGRRLRYAAPLSRDGGTEGEPGPWLEIVGVVEDFYTNSMDAELIWPTLYHAISWREATDALLVLRVREDPEEAIPAVRRIAAGVDSSLRLSPRALTAVNRQQQIAVRLIGTVFAIVMVAVLLLCAAGIYALMSFAVTRQRREIGIRTALGALPWQLLASVFRRAAAQLAVGVALGVAGAFALAGPLEALTDGAERLIVPAVVLLVTVVGLIATWGPARRGLRVDPTEALRAE